MDNYKITKDDLARLISGKPLEFIGEHGVIRIVYDEIIDNDILAMEELTQEIIKKATELKVGAASKMRLRK